MGWRCWAALGMFWPWLAVAGEQCLVDPAKGKLVAVAPYGRLPDGRSHAGLDFELARAGQLQAPADGEMRSTYLSGQGNLVVIERKNGDAVFLSGLDAVLEPKEGQPFRRGIHASGGFEKAGKANAGKPIAVAGQASDAGTAGNEAAKSRFHLAYSRAATGRKELDRWLLQGRAKADITATHGLPEEKQAWEAVEPGRQLCTSFPLQEAGQTAGDTRALSQQRKQGELPLEEGPQWVAAQDLQRSKTSPLSNGSRYGMSNPALPRHYGQLSFAAMLQTEASRRFASWEWNEGLTRWSDRSLWVEYARMMATTVRLRQEIDRKKQHAELLLSLWTLYATQRELKPRVEANFRSAQDGRMKAMTSQQESAPIKK